MSHNRSGRNNDGFTTNILFEKINMIPPAHGIVRSFVVTSLWDLALNTLPPPLGAVILKDYFKQHTKLAAALIAGITGAVTFCVIVFLFPEALMPSLRSIIIIFTISSLIGFPMKHSGIFPHLTKHYYNKIPRLQSFGADGLSGVMVAVTYWILLHLGL